MSATATATPAASAPQEIQIQQIAIRDLVPSPLNPRKTIDAAFLAQLASSIEQLGVQVPLLVRPVFEADDLDRPVDYEIVAGHRRYFAAKQTKLAVLPCIVREMADEEAREIMVVENLQREDLPALEEAAAYEGLLATLGTAPAVAARVGKPIEYVTRRLKLRTLTALARRALAEKLITLDHALLLAKLADKEQEAMLKWALDKFAGVKTSCDKVLDETLKRRKDRSYWEPQSVLELKQHIEQETNLALRKAPWDLKDAQLVPSAGACTECPKNTAANTALFGDLKVEQACCTDSKCFDAKRQAFVQLQLDAVKSAGADAVRVSWKMTSSKPRALDNTKKYLGQVFKYGQWIDAKKGTCEFVRAGVTVDFDDSRWNNDAKKKPGMRITVCVEPDCKVHRKAWEKAAASGGVGPRQNYRQAEAEQEAKRKAYVKRETPIREAVYESIKASKPKADAVFRQLLVVVLGAPAPSRADVLGAMRGLKVKGAWDSKPLTAAVARAKDGEIAGWALDVLCSGLLAPREYSCDRVQEDRSGLWAIAKAFGVNADAIAKNFDKLPSPQKPEAPAKAPAKPTKPALKAKSTKVAKKKAVRK